MAVVKYSRLDDKKSSSSFCSTVIIVVFVALCLVGVWMMTSSSVVPVPNTDDVASQESAGELKTQVIEENSSGDEGKSKPSERSSGISYENSNGSNENNENGGSEENSSGGDVAKPKVLESGGSNENNENNGSEENSSGGDVAKPKVLESGGSNENNEKNGSEENSSGGDEAKSKPFEGNSGISYMSTSGNYEGSNNASGENSSGGDDEAKPKTFEDNPGNLPVDATKNDTVIPEAKTTGENQEVVEEKKDEPKFDDGSKGASGNVEEKKEIEERKVEDKDSERGDNNENKSGEDVNKSNANDAENKPEEASSDKENGQIEEKVEDKKDPEGSMGVTQDNVSPPVESSLPSDVPKIYEGSGEKVSLDEALGDVKNDEKGNLKPEEMPENKKDNNSLGESKEPLNEVFPSVAQSELLNETSTQNGAFSTQAMESKKEKLAEKSLKLDKGNGYIWKLCNITAGADYIPCLDNLEAIKNLRTTMHYEHRERHCPSDPPTCLVPLPKGYQRSIKWPTSREKIWYRNVPHTKLADFKGHQNWVKANGEYLTFPGGGTQFTHGALHYIDTIQKSLPDIAWGKRSRVVLDVGCGVASFGGYLFERDVLTMSLAPKDEHEAQVQFALERGIPAISAVMGTNRLPFPGRVFDIVHCARCRVPWHIEGGKLLLELNRLLRPGGFFVWSATPVYRKEQEDSEIWEAMKNLTMSMCWDLVSVTKDRLNKVGIAIYKKPTSNECYEQRTQDDPPLCQESDDPDAAWNVALKSCMHKIPTGASDRGSKWPEQWPSRLEKSPYWLLSSQTGVYGKPAPEDFTVDFQHWKRVVTKTYLNGMGIDWSTVRNVMDMRAIYGGFAAALKELNVWVMNIISIDAPDTLPVIYERGLFGIYHDWCESFSTYPRSYDLLHADHLFSKIKAKCGLPALVAEVDRILRPEGKLIVRDSLAVIGELQAMLRAMHYEIRMSYSRDKEGLLCVKKTMWRPKEVQTLTYAIE